MEVFHIIYPSPLLASYIRYYWILKIEKQDNIAERTLPTGSINLIFHKGDRMFSSTDNELQPQSFVSGFSMDYSDLEATGCVDMICVVFQPYGAKAFFDMPVNEFYDRNISVHDIGDKSLSDLEDRLLNVEDNSQGINLIEQFFIKRLHTVGDYNRNRIVAAINAVNKQSQVNVKTLADISCLSYKQFNRVFTQYIGANPKTFSRVVRFQRALYILQINPKTNLSYLAYECGYSDQSHLIKEFKTLSGYTPLEYMNVCTPYSDYFSLP